MSSFIPRFSVPNVHILPQIAETHVYNDQNKHFYAQNVFAIVEEIFAQATSPSGHPTDPAHQGGQGTMEKLLQRINSQELLQLSNAIHEISCEISCKCSSSGDVHTTTMAILKVLSKWSWDAKAVIALLAFAVLYTETLLVTQLSKTNPLANAIVQLKHERDDPFKELKSLINAMLDVVKNIFKLKDYIQAESFVRVAAYWSILTSVVCSSQIVGLIDSKFKYKDQQVKLTDFEAFMVKEIKTNLELKIDEHEKKKVKRMLKDQLEKLERLFTTQHGDNVEIIETLFGADIFHGSKKTTVKTRDVLGKKTVLMFISEVEVSDDELYILDQTYKSRQANQFEIVWFPIPSSPTQIGKLGSFQQKMPWYSVSQLPSHNGGVTGYIKEKWHFKKKPMIVVLEQTGKLVVNPNAFHMMAIWGSMAFPFTSEKEEYLWKHKWSIDVLVEPICPNFSQLIKEKMICIYGGEDSKWINDFTKKVHESKIKMEMLYVGKTNTKETIFKEIHDFIGKFIPNQTSLERKAISSFWVRLHSMWFIKIQHSKSMAEKPDPIVQAIMTMLSFGGSKKGWAVIIKGKEMAVVEGKVILDTSHDEWKKDGFVAALNKKMLTEHHCYRLTLDPGWNAPDMVYCAVCLDPMEKFTMYRCCKK